jgi:hypothetical protein
MTFRSTQYFARTGTSSPPLVPVLVGMLSD